MSDQPKHTPGDWLAKRAEGGGYVEWHIGRDGEARAIASDITDPVTGLPSKANAHLIAAAPDLLEAVDTLTLVIGLTPILGNKQALQEALDAARAAIAKAEGRGA